MTSTQTADAVPTAGATVPADAVSSAERHEGHEERHEGHEERHEGHEERHEGHEERHEGQHDEPHRMRPIARAFVLGNVAVLAVFALVVATGHLQTGGALDLSVATATAAPTR